MLNRAMHYALAKLRDWRLSRYFMVSVAALAVDLCVFFALISRGAAEAAAAAIGYVVGGIVHWILSSRTVFRDGAAHDRIARTFQKALFVASALAGLLVTTVIVGAGTAAGLPPALAKLFAVGTSFALIYLLRLHVVFRTGAAR
jgi:putative flippase GtrA